MSDHRTGHNGSSRAAPGSSKWPWPALRGSATAGWHGKSASQRLIRWSAAAPAVGSPSVYGSSALVENGQLAVVRGRAHLTGYESSPGKTRYFCSGCGCHVFAIGPHAGGEKTILRIGTLEPGHGLRPEGHIHVQDKADWYEIRDSLPQHLAE